MTGRPPRQRWIKRPPRPSRTASAQEVRERPGWAQFAMAAGFGLLAAVLGALVGPQLVPRPGMGGLFAGLGLVIGFITVWRGLGGTGRDIRDLFG